jgi:predicted dehydrogenase
MKILMVGLGGIGQRHVRNLRTLMGANIDIIAYRFRNDTHVLTDQLMIEHGSNLLERYSIKIYDKFDEALNQKPDIVFVCNPSSLHIPIALQAARVGCHLFIEKPLSHNMDGVEELIQLIENKHIKAVAGYQMRFHPCLKRLYSLVQEQAIGRILAVRIEVGDYLPSWHGYEDYRQLYASKKELGGGVILTQIHELDYLYWLLGLPKRLFAVGGHLSTLEIDVEDTVDILIEYLIDGRTIPVSVHQDFVQNPSNRMCTIIGDAGKILVDIRSLTVNVYDTHGNLSETNSYEIFQRNQLFLDELQDFLKYLNDDDKRSLVSLSDAVQSLRIALAAKESLEMGKIVELKR